MRYVIGNSDIDFNYEVIDTEKNTTIIKLNLYKNTKLVCDILNADLLCHSCLCDESQHIKELEKENDKLHKELDETKDDVRFYRNIGKNYAQQLYNLRQEKYPVSFDCFKKLKIQDERDREWYLKGFNNCEKQISSNFVDTQKELELYKKALKLACERLSREDVFESQSIPKFYLQQAKEKTDGNKNKI